jgi:hypothetical protein
MIAPELLVRVVGALDRAGIPYMVAGSIASAYYSQPRTTRGIDIVIDPTRTSLTALLDALDPIAYHVDRDAAIDALRRRSMFNVIDLATGWKIDLVVRRARPFSVEELRRRRPGVILGVATFVASAEDTILAKLEWAKQGGGSERQLRDCADIVGVQGDALDRAHIETWAAELGVLAEWAQVKDG